MSLLINGMDMPKNGQITIELASEDTGTNILALITDDKTGKLIGHEGVVVFPTLHGRLIDADRLIAVIKSAAGTADTNVPLSAVLASIENAPTVIEREEV